MRPRCAAALLFLVVALAVGACRGNSDEPAPQVGDPGPIHVHGLGINPSDGALFVATHTGRRGRSEDSCNPKGKAGTGRVPGAVSGAFLRVRSAPGRECSRDQGDRQGSASAEERLDQLVLAERWVGHDDHWKISVVQSPPWRRTSWARAGPSGRAWKSTKKSRSTSIPPSGWQFTFSSQERSSG